MSGRRIAFELDLDDVRCRPIMLILAGEAPVIWNPTDEEDPDIAPRDKRGPKGAEGRRKAQRSARTVPGASKAVEAATPHVGDELSLGEVERGVRSAVRARFADDDRYEIVPGAGKRSAIVRRVRPR